MRSILASVPGDTVFRVCGKPASSQIRIRPSAWAPLDLAADWKVRAPSCFELFSGFRLDDPDFWIALVDLIFEPLARIIFAVPKQNDAWIDLADEVQELIAVRVSSQIKVLDFAMPR